jgi:S1-C subfamily serine protease
MLRLLKKMKLFKLPVIALIIFTNTAPQTLAQNTHPENSVVQVISEIEFLDTSKILSLDNIQVKKITVGGSGVIFGKYVVTNSHVVEGFKNVTFKKNNGDFVPATFLGSSYCDDVAIFKIHNKEDFGNNTFRGNFEKNETLTSYGYNSSSPKIQYRKGKISALSREMFDSKQVAHESIEIDNDIDFGFSGGGVFDQKNTLVGINQSLAKDTKKTYIVPFYLIKKLIVDIESNRYIYTGGLSGMATFSPFLDKYGAIVTAVTPKSKKSEIQVGDIITEINGNELQALSPYNTFCSAIPKDATTLQVKGYHIKNQKEFNIQLNK